MYSEELEQYLANKIEEPAKEAIVKIRTRQTISSTERISIAKYIVTLWKRVPKARARASALLPGVAESLRNELHGELSAAAVVHPDLSARAEERKAEVSRIISAYEADPPAEMWHHTIGRHDNTQLVDCLLSMQWKILFSNEQRFLSGDNPVFFFPHEGVGSPKSELTVPFSSTVTLWMNRLPSTNHHLVRATPAIVREINRRTAFNAERFVYSEQNEPWILPFICKTDYTLNRLR